MFQHRFQQSRLALDNDSIEIREAFISDVRELTCYPAGFSESWQTSAVNRFLFVSDDAIVYLRWFVLAAVASNKRQIGSTKVLISLPAVQI